MQYMRVIFFSVENAECPVSNHDTVKSILACQKVIQGKSGLYRITQSKKLYCKHFISCRLFAI